MELFLLRGTSFVESVADGFVQDCSYTILEKNIVDSARAFKFARVALKNN